MDTSLPPQVNPPPGWTVYPTYAAYKEEWEGLDSQGQTIAQCYGLGPGTPIMEDDQAVRTIFQSGDRYYLWDRKPNSVHEFASQNIHEILSTMTKDGLRGLHMEALSPVLDVDH